ncbi:MAG: DUF6950 family protein [Alphaproteobacteria bacterium]
MRRHDWDASLIAFVEARAKTPFEWGGNDCALFVCDAIQVMTGIDPAGPFRGRYKTAMGAARALKKYAGGGLLATADKITADLGFQTIEPLFAGRGDLGVIEGTVDGLPALAICVGLSWACVGLAGLEHHQTADVLTAWKVN